MQYQIPVIPYPHAVTLTGERRIYPYALAAGEEGLRQNADSLREQASRLGGAAFADAEGGIVLLTDVSVPREGYRLDVGADIKLYASAYIGFAHGLATVLRMGELLSEGMDLPCGVIEDAPDRPFRGVMIDLARAYHPMEQVMAVLDMCFFLKLNILHLHFTDDELYTLPSAAYPRLADPASSYTREEIDALNARALALGVELLPEIDLPGHAGSFLRAYPEVFGTRPFSDRALGVGRESVYDAVDVLIGEVCDLFPHSSMIHMGGDEVQDAGWRACEDCAAYMQTHGIPSVEALYSHAVGRMARMIESHGRRPVIWEGFPPEGTDAIPQNALVMPFECLYHQPADLLRSGFDLVSASWKPLYITQDISWPWPDIYDGWKPWIWHNWWHVSAAYPDPMVVEDSPKILGAQIYSWSLVWEEEWPPVVRNSIALAERLWYEAAPFTSEEFRVRHTREYRLMQKVKP